MKVLEIVKTPDKEKERAERQRTLSEFMASYNGNLPAHFPKATRKNLLAFKRRFPDLFESGSNTWSLDRHRKKLKDWLPQYEKGHDS